jgi:hypothetical protein
LARPLLCVARMQGSVSAPLPLSGYAAPRSRRGQLVGFAMLWLLVLLGALGVLGKGPLNERTIANDRVQVQYERVLRVRASTEFRIAASTVGPRVRVEVESTEPSELALDPIVPEPATQQLTARGAVLDFAAQGGAVLLALRETPHRIGPRKVRITVDRAEPLWIRQVVLP